MKNKLLMFFVLVSATLTPVSYAQLMTPQQRLKVQQDLCANEAKLARLAMTERQAGRPAHLLRDYLISVTDDAESKEKIKEIFGYAYNALVADHEGIKRLRIDIFTTSYFDVCLELHISGHR